MSDKDDAQAAVDAIAQALQQRREAEARLRELGAPQARHTFPALPAEVRAGASELLLSGLTPADVVRLIGGVCPGGTISIASARRLQRELDLSPGRGRPPDTERRDKARQMQADGATVEEIRQAIGGSEAAVRRFLRG